MFIPALYRKSARSIYLLLLALPSLFLLAAMLSTTAHTAPATNDPVVWLEAPGGPVEAGEEITVTVRISDIVDLYGIQFSLDFEPSALTVLDQDPALTDVQIAPADCPATDFVVKNKVDNAAGKLEYAVTQISPTPPVNGDCVVAHIRFQTWEATSTQLRITDLILADPAGAPITANSTGLQLNIGGDHQVFLPALFK